MVTTPPPVSPPGDDRLSAELVGSLVAAQRARADRLLNGVRAVVLPLLAVAAVVYAPALSPTLRRVNGAVLALTLAWTFAQYLLFYRRDRRCPAWVGAVSPIVDTTAVTIVLLGYGLSAWPSLALKAPIFLAYFVIIAARPMTGSTRQAAATAFLACFQYAALIVALVLLDRVSFAADPLQAAVSARVSLLDEGAKLLLLALAGAVATFATAWHERLLRRALAAQVARDAEEQTLVVRLQEADKLAALGTLAASIAHEVSNPLATVTSLAEMLERELAGGEHAQQRADAVAIAEEARRAAGVVRDLLTFARRRETTPVPVSLSDVAERALDVLRLFIRDNAVIVERELRRDVEPVVGDPSALERVVLNLVINAVQALEGRDGPRVVRVSTDRDARGVWLAVEDTGPGIEPAAAGRIFERFYTTKPAGKGTGLGLWLARQTVGECGGDILAENRADHPGACFTVLFPLRDGAAAMRMPPAPTGGTTSRRATPREAPRQGFRLPASM